MPRHGITRFGMSGRVKTGAQQQPGLTTTGDGLTIFSVRSEVADFGSGQ